MLLSTVTRALRLSLNTLKAFHLSRDTTRNMSLRPGIFWLDLEMTGLDVEKCHIMEIACLATDPQLNLIEEGPEIVVHQPDEALNAMGEWCTKQHGKSGLTDASRRSQISLKEAEQRVLSFCKRLTGKNQWLIGGNSVYYDRIFVINHLPALFDYLDHRVIDVSTLKALSGLWYGMKPLTKKYSHRAMDDIKASVEELKYLSSMLKKPDETESTECQTSSNGKRAEFIWIDLKLTGKNLKSHIVQISCTITDHNLNFVANCPDVVIHHDAKTLESMESSYVQNYKTRGLYEASLKSNTSYNDAEKLLIDFCLQHTTRKSCYFAGTTIYHDKAFLHKYTPLFTEHAHYRIIDNSSIKQIAKFFFNVETPELDPFSSCTTDAIEELNFLRKTVFK